MSRRFKACKTDFLRFYQESIHILFFYAIKTSLGYNIHGLNLGDAKGEAFASPGVFVEIKYEHFTLTMPPNNPYLRRKRGLKRLKTYLRSFTGQERLSNYVPNSK